MSVIVFVVFLIYLEFISATDNQRNSPFQYLGLVVEGVNPVLIIATSDNFFLS
ncbi:hypothetical protein [Methanosphaera cuniculi]|uniref:hypothetical protein n=1 Tax=Methanosphaera cuniculi TaxID=1077256 RepID=UPI0026EA3EF9|nr:hypothetical protein [Methanosphaera cuniculi]